MTLIPVEKINNLSITQENRQVSAVNAADPAEGSDERGVFPASARVVRSKKVRKQVYEELLKPEQQNPDAGQLVFSKMENSKPETDDIIGLLEATGTQYVDKRASGGCLWIIGGRELSETVKKAKELGCNFRFKKEGGRVTKNKPGWWAK